MSTETEKCEDHGRGDIPERNRGSDINNLGIEKVTYYIGEIRSCEPQWF